jgi:hypothetical protein
MRTNLRTAQAKANNRYLVGGRTRALPRIALRPPVEERRFCKYCGCTDDRACPQGCCWITDDVCSACAGELGDLL